MKVTQSCLTLCNPVDYTVHGILQARILEWVAFPFSRGIFPTQVSYIAGGFCKEIQPVHSEGDQPWGFFGGNDAEAETPALWPSCAKECESHTPGSPFEEGAPRRPSLEGSVA